MAMLDPASERGQGAERTLHAVPYPVLCTLVAPHARTGRRPAATAPGRRHARRTTSAAATCSARWPPAVNLRRPVFAPGRPLVGEVARPAACPSGGRAAKRPEGACWANPA